MQKVLNLYKPVGMTPLQLIDKWKERHPEYKTLTLSYAGRLDPMAEGILVVLVGEENKNRNRYEAMPKTYEFTLLLGIATDTYDLLGKLTDYKSEGEYPQINREMIESFIGEYTQTLPPYSSFTVRGKPLYYWARREKLEEISLPKKNIHIYSLQLLRESTINAPELLKKVSEEIPKVTGDFRQEEILTGWHYALSQNKNATFPLYTFSIDCSSGTYVRSLVQAIGETVSSPALTFHINRTKVGDFRIEDAIRLH